MVGFDETALPIRLTNPEDSYGGGFGPHRAGQWLGSSAWRPMKWAMNNGQSRRS